MNTEIQASPIKEYYEMLSTGEQLRIHAEGMLEKPAYSILEKELARISHQCENSAISSCHG